MIQKITRIPLRDAFKREALDFTRWLEENIDLLNDCLDITLSNAEREQAAGDFSVDIVCEDESGSKVIIENQLEKSNHDHLGKVITYLVALEAKTAIWIVSDPRPEHVSAITWLNEASTASFYLLKLEAIQIGDSAPAPLLTLIVGPSESTKAARMTQDDIFHNNNRNLFLASEETLKASVAESTLMLDCHWLEPAAIGGEVVEAWRHARVPFSDLSLDQVGQRVFYRDCEGLKAGLAKDAGEEALKQRFYLWWRHSKRSWQDIEWTEAKREFRRRGVFLPEYPSDVLGLLNAHYSAREGKSIGWNHPNFISAANTVANSYKNVVRAFRATLLVYGRGEQLTREDKKGNWAKRVKEYKERLAAGDKDYDRDPQYDSLIAFLFPEVWGTLSGSNGG